MLKNLVAGQEQVVRTAREVFTRADNANDQPTADLQCTKRPRDPRGCCARCSPEPGLQRIERVTSVGAGRRSDQRPNQQSRVNTIAPINRLTSTSPEHDRGIGMGAGSEGLSLEVRAESSHR
jgi:hypothetical protein